jgi:hypothetical protein
MDYDGDEEENIIDAEGSEEDEGEEGEMEGVQYNNNNNGGKKYVVVDGEAPVVEIEPPFDVKGFVKASADKYFPKETEESE